MYDDLDGDEGALDGHRSVLHGLRPALRPAGDRGGEPSRFLKSSRAANGGG